MEDNKKVLNLEVELKTFVPQGKSDSIEYISSVVCVGGKHFRLVPSEQDKSLFNYIIKKEVFKK